MFTYIYSGSVTQTRNRKHLGSKIYMIAVHYDICFDSQKTVLPSSVSLKHPWPRSASLLSHVWYLVTQCHRGKALSWSWNTHAFLLALPQSHNSIYYEIRTSTFFAFYVTQPCLVLTILAKHMTPRYFDCPRLSTLSSPCSHNPIIQFTRKSGRQKVSCFFVTQPCPVTTLLAKCMIPRYFDCPGVPMPSSPCFHNV